jgi:3-oxoacyl-[acyl-carrier protein] reductase
MAALVGKSVLITGGGSGIGRGVAKYFVERGARVVITGRRESKLKEVCGELKGDISYVVGDVTDNEERKKMINTSVEFGGGLDALISNAGNMYRCDVEDFNEEKLLQVFHSNVIGGMMLVKEAYQALKDSEGCVIFVGSVHTQRAFPNASPYAATKGALEALTGVLAAELGKDNIRVGCIRPGGVPTEINVRAGLSSQGESDERLKSMGNLHALGRPGTTEEVAEAFEYLVNAKWATGNILTIDGGLGLGVTQE